MVLGLTSPGGLFFSFWVAETNYNSTPSPLEVSFYGYEGIVQCFPLPSIAGEVYLVHHSENEFPQTSS